MTSCSGLEGHLNPEIFRADIFRADIFRADIFRAMGDETRLALIARLACAADPMTVTEAAGCCGVHLSGVSRHLAALRNAGVVTARKQGREVRYSLDCGALAGALRDLATALESCCANTRRTQ